MYIVITVFFQSQNCLCIVLDKIETEELSIKMQEYPIEGGIYLDLVDIF